jgi:subtilisin-like proprotein convertase family protein
VNGSLVFTSTASLAIRDNQTTTSSITIGPNVTIQDVNVKLNISHTQDSDLLITLTSPAGTKITLVNRRGGSGDNFTNTVFDSEATRAITSGSPPFTGSFRPEQSLGTYNGKAAIGTWKLSVSDQAAGHTGTLQNWSLLIQAR